MNKNFVILGLLLVIFSLGSIIGVATIVVDLEEERVPCYDKYGSVIIGEVCEGYSEDTRMFQDSLTNLAFILALSLMAGLCLLVAGFTSLEDSLSGRSKNNA